MKRSLRRHDVVQIDPQQGGHFGGQLMIVEDVYAWGAVGFFVAGLTKNTLLEPPFSRAYYRVPNDMMEYVGHLTWVPEQDDLAWKQQRGRLGGVAADSKEAEPLDPPVTT